MRDNIYLQCLVHPFLEPSAAFIPVVSAVMLTEGYGATLSGYIAGVAVDRFGMGLATMPTRIEIRELFKMVLGNQPAVPATTQSLHCLDHPLPKQTITTVLAPNASDILLAQIEIHAKVIILWYNICSFFMKNVIILVRNKKNPLQL
ncbi:MAG: hypothetical protein IBX70_13505 [Clostridia bacterium]|nr:hypothetical protein [Clostridia bacterium]